MEKLTNEEIIGRVNVWQDAGFVHPLTCLVSKHGNLYPEIVAGKVVLKCNNCKRIQENIPPSILTIPPQEMKDEKIRLEKLGFKFNSNPQLKP